MKFAGLLIVIGLLKKALQLESAEHPTTEMLAQVPEKTFSNYSSCIQSKLTVICRKNSSAPINQSLDCFPSYYNWQSHDTKIRKTEDYAPEGRILRWKTDCWGDAYYDQCGLVWLCWDTYNYPYFDCKVYGSQGSISERSQTFSNGTSTGQIEANCIAKTVTLTNGSKSSSVECSPPYYYNYKTASRRISTRSLYDWTGGNLTRGFYTDCFGDYYSDGCYWIAQCWESNYNAFGFECKVFQADQRQNESNCSSTVYSNSSDDWCANCTSCSYFNGSQNVENITCRPCRNYSWSTSDYSVHTFTFYNTGFPDNKERFFTTDCSGPNNCAWCTNAYARYEGGFKVKKCTNSSATNVSRRTYKYELGYGIDWCANCTVNGSDFGGCTPCTSWAPYTNVTCKYNISRVSLPGMTWCSNCTTCSDGFQICRPCVSPFGMSPDDSFILASKPIKSRRTHRRDRRHLRKRHTRHAHLIDQLFEVTPAVEFQPTEEDLFESHELAAELSP
jgi:hypothetical protein